MGLEVDGRLDCLKDPPALPPETAKHEEVAKVKVRKIVARALTVDLRIFGHFEHTVRTCLTRDNKKFRVC